MRGAAAAIGAAGFVIGLGSCLPDVVYRCSEPDDCADLGEGARCEMIGYCSYADADCDSGQRFHDYAGEGLAGLCTDASCGNGKQDPGEECDDANKVEGDGCNNDCRTSGQEIWTAIYASPGDVRDRCNAIAADTQGNAAVVGQVALAPDDSERWARAYDADGEPVWTWDNNGEGPFEEEAWAIRALPGDEWLGTGSVATADGFADLWVGHLDTAGQIVAQATFESNPNDTYHDVGRDVVVAPDGDVVIVGLGTPDRALEEDILIQRRSADLQTVKWTVFRSSGVANAQDHGHGVVAIDGGFIGIGEFQDDAGAYWPWIERFDNDGNTVWDDSGKADGPNASLTAAALSADGSVIVVGRKESAAGDTDMWLQARDIIGNVLWQEVVASPEGADDAALAVVADGRGGFVVGGQMGVAAGSSDTWLRRYGPDRTEVWTVEVSGSGGEDATWGVAIGPDGTVWACGYQTTPGSESDLWVRRYTP